MNPGKVVKPYRIDENLRLGVDYSPWEPDTHFAYPDDGGSFAHATLRCVGVGKCRRLNGEGDQDTMCPSFMVTREEKDSTRGRAHLLFEMLQKGPIKDGWRDEHVKESLDLCLSCKGCKGDCPVNVVAATYKAEFLSHYWEGRLRPVSAYAFGLIDQWSRLASVAPGVVNLVTQLAKVMRATRPDRDQVRARWLAVLEEDGDRHVRVDVSHIEEARGLVALEFGLWTMAPRRNISLCDGPTRPPHGFISRSAPLE
jgi:hypothetical protein